MATEPTGKPDMKQCGSCKVVKGAAEYYADKRAKSGLQVNCKECLKKYYSENREKYRELKNGNKAYIDKCKEYFLNNKDSVNEYKKERYSTDEGKAKVKCVNQLRRSLKVTTSDGTVTPDFILSLFKKQDYKCAISGKCIKNEYHIDHIIPLAKGGKHVSSNIQLLNPSVNMSKKDKIYETY